MTSQSPHFRPIDTHGIPAITRSVVGYLLRRFPPHTQGLALLGAYACAWLWYRRAADGKGPPAQLGDVAAFLLMFLLLRLVDDLDDVSVDYPDDAEAARSRYRHLGLGYVVVCALFIGLQLSAPGALVILGAFVVVSGVTLILLKRWMRPRRALLCLGYEGMPLLAMALPWVQWRVGAEGPVSLGMAAALTVLFWGCYEVWKFARRAAIAGYEPYRLAWPQRRRLLLAILLADVALGIALTAVSGPGAGLGFGFAGLAAIFSAWILVGPKREGQAPAVSWLPPVGYAGLAYVFCFELLNVVFLVP